MCYAPNPKNADQYVQQECAQTKLILLYRTIRIMSRDCNGNEINFLLLVDLMSTPAVIDLFSVTVPNMLLTRSGSSCY